MQALRHLLFSDDELREAIEAPAAQVGLKFEQGVADLLLQDILGEPAGLPLLQFTLLKLWEQRERNRVTRAVYERVGGGRLALARSADALYQGLIPEDQVTARALAEVQRNLAEAQSRTARRLRRAAIALVMLLIVALLTAGYAFVQQNEATNQQNVARTAEAQALSDANGRATAQAQAQHEAATAQAAFAAQSQFAAASETGLLLAYEAAKRDTNPITEQTLRDALDRYPAIVHRLREHTGPVIRTVFSPDGQRILTASADNSARLYLVRVEDLLAVAACRVPRGLTEEEITRFDVGTPRFDFEQRQCPAALQ